MTVREMIEELKELPGDYAVEMLEGVFQPGEAIASGYRRYKPHSVAVLATAPVVLIAVDRLPANQEGLANA